MAKIAEADLRSAAARVSSTPPTGVRGAGGVRDPEIPWQLLKGKVARSIAATPDLVWYFAYLHSNLASAKAREVVKTLSEMLPLVEGLYKEQTEVAEATAASKFLGLTSSSVLDATRVSAIETRVDKYVAQELIPNLKAGSRLQKKGAEARTSYQKAKKTLLKQWKTMLALLEGAVAERQATAEDVRSVAAQLPLENLQRTLDMEAPADNLLNYTLQVAAALSAVKAMARPFDVRRRIFISSKETFPEGTTLEETFTEGVLSALSFGKSSKELGLRSGDVVSRGGNTATVRTVGDTSVTLQDSLIVDSSGTFEIKPALFLSWKEMQVALTSSIAALPTTKMLKRQMQQKEGPSAAEVRNLIVYLSSVSVRLDALSSATTTLLSRVGGEVSAVDPSVLATLDAFAPPLPRKLKKAGDALLAEVKGGGFDFAHGLLLRGNIRLFFLLSSVGASKKARAANLISNVTSGGH